MAFRVLIPARYASTRLPGKVLMPLAGRPMIEHVWRRASRAEGLERVVVLRAGRAVADGGPTEVFAEDGWPTLRGAGLEPPA